jgi:hypothetical protein
MAVGFPVKADYATGDVLTAANMNDFAGTLNLFQSTLYPAGRNKIINGDFRFNQREFTTTTTSGAYGFDRFQMLASDGTSTYSAETFTTGAAPVAGYEAKNFARLVSTGQTLTTARTLLTQKIESVRNFAGQNVVVSFWAKASTGTPSVAAGFQQHFGTGGSPSANVETPAGKIAITTSWARYQFNVALPSISGKTIGTAANTDFLAIQLITSAGSTFNTISSSLGIQSATIDFWGLQVEAASTGSTASPFQTATGTIQGELALCQRYFYRQGAPVNYSYYGLGLAVSTTASRIMIPLPVNMRVEPSSVSFSNLALYDGVSIIDLTTLTIAETNVQTPSLTASVAAGLTQFRPYSLISNNSTAGFLSLNAEL